MKLEQKLDEMNKTLTDIQVKVGRIDAVMEEREKLKINDRVTKLEAFKWKALGVLTAISLISGMLSSEIKGVIDFFKHG